MMLHETYHLGLFAFNNKMVMAPIMRSHHVKDVMNAHVVAIGIRKVGIRRSPATRCMVILHSHPKNAFALFLANPDLPMRFKRNADLNVPCV